MGELPDAEKPGGSGVRQDMTDDRRTGEFVKQRRVEKGGENGGGRRGGQGVLALVELVLEGRAAIRLAVLILMWRGVLVVPTRQEFQARKLFQLAVIARRRPEKGQQDNQDCFHEPHRQ